MNAGKGSFGATLKAARVANKITLREFAKQKGQDAGNLSRTERGETLPSYRAVPVWCKIYGLDQDAVIRAYLSDLAARIMEIP